MCRFWFGIEATQYLQIRFDVDIYKTNKFLNMNYSPTVAPLKFIDEAGTYKLIMSLEHAKLEITLEDFIDWTIYSKSFDDCGGASKMSLKKFYDCFALSDLIQLRNYKFGTTVKHNFNYAFKIENGGKLTAFLDIINPETNTEEHLETQLELEKIKDMNPEEIQAKMMEINRNLFIKGSQNQFQEQPNLNQQDAAYLVIADGVKAPKN